MALPCLMPHLNVDCVLPCLVMMVTGTLCMVSAAHSTKTCVGHPRLCRAVQRSSGVILSKNFSSSSLRCPMSECLYWLVSSVTARWMSVRSSTE